MLHYVDQSVEKQKQSFVDRQYTLLQFLPSRLRLKKVAHSDGCQHKWAPEMLHAVTWVNEMKAESTLLMHCFT